MLDNDRNLEDKYIILNIFTAPPAAINSYLKTVFCSTFEN